MFKNIKNLLVFIILSFCVETFLQHISGVYTSILYAHAKLHFLISILFDWLNKMIESNIEPRIPETTVVTECVGQLVQNC